MGLQASSSIGRFIITGSPSITTAYCCRLVHEDHGRHRASFIVKSRNVARLRKEGEPFVLFLWYHTCYLPYINRGS